MDGQQILVLTVGPVSTLVIVMVGVLMNNTRLSTLETHLNTRMNDLRDLLRAEMAKNHSELLIKFAELDHRIDKLEVRVSRIEDQLGIK
ncbi:MAG: hypothetical protein NTV70_10510 [Acidobacteria bacterium]|nr:hypothetical protein [Acidobacteriota bacterium]